MTIKEVQEHLIKLGYTSSSADGIFGGLTSGDIKKFQKSRNLVVDGLPGLVTQEALQKAVAGAPVKSAVPLAKDTAALPFAIGKVTRPIDTLVIHCTATQAGKELSRASLKAMHKVRGFNDIGYHAFQHLDGKWEIGRPWNTVGAHVEGHNTGSLGFSYVGGVIDAAGKIARDTRTPEQKTEMHNMVKATLKAIPTIKKIKGHRDFSPDKNRNGMVEPNEWIKQCPCFGAIPEFAYLLK